MILLSHPTGNANVRAALLGLFEANLLKEFHTTVASYPGNLWDVLGNSRFGAQFQRRKYDERLQSLTVQHPFRELGRMLTSHLKINRLGRHEQGAFCVDAIYRELDKVAAKRLRESPAAFTGVYAYEDGALKSFTAARERGWAAIYDLPIGHWRTYRKLLKDEFERMPDWASTLTGFSDSPEKLDRKDGELARATKIIVASSFTAGTLKDYPEKLASPVVVPYGFPEVSSKSERHSRGPVTKANPLRLLFVGGLSQRKGIADLFAAATILGPIVSLTVIGTKVTADCPALDKELARHRWIPSLPHGEILNEMRMHDVLVLPSLFEGFGLVISEAMSQGTPVITTERTAGPDLITHGENGWLIKAGSKDQLARQLEELVKSPAAVQEAGLRACQKAAARPWSIYGRELATAITKIS
ncbi:MAG TPA: glycosyltransferase family 4 protein [Verrucomicrobiae bacterium]|nr:glycosyltransferase family 4 protein [Verrucomicrobiae bacterium]